MPFLRTFREPVSYYKIHSPPHSTGLKGRQLMLRQCETLWSPATTSCKSSRRSKPRSSACRKNWITVSMGAPLSRHSSSHQMRSSLTTLLYKSRLANQSQHPPVTPNWQSSLTCICSSTQATSRKAKLKTSLLLLERSPRLKLTIQTSRRTFGAGHSRTQSLAQLAKLTASMWLQSSE